MSAAILVLALLLCVAVSAVLVRVARLPLPLTQIALGAAISVPSFGLHVDLEPKLFLLLFIPPLLRSEEHTSELQSLMRISYAVFCLKKKKQKKLRQIYTSDNIQTKKHKHT